MGKLRKQLKRGDMIARFATPLARALRLPCVDRQTGRLKPDSGCSQMQTDLNNGLTMGQALKNRIVRKVSG